MYSPIFARKVELLLKLMPFVMNEGVFAVHGGTAINLFVKDMPRYSVDIDLTYMPLAGREESLRDINAHLQSIIQQALPQLPGLHVVPNYDTCKLLCEYHGYQVKVEVKQGLFLYARKRRKSSGYIARRLSFRKHFCMAARLLQLCRVNIRETCLISNIWTCLLRIFAKDLFSVCWEVTDLFMSR